MGSSRIHTSRKPVGSGSLARSAAEHSPSVGQMNASPYINANVRSPLAEQSEVVNPLNVRPKSGSSVTSDEFYDVETPPLPAENELPSMPSAPEQQTPAQNQSFSQPPLEESDLSRSNSALTTTTTATQTPVSPQPQAQAQAQVQNNWYDYQGDYGNAYLPRQGAEGYSQEYAQYPQVYQNQEQAQQFDPYQQYQYQQAYGYDPYQMYGYPSQSNLYPATSGSTTAEQPPNHSFDQNELSNSSSVSVGSSAYMTGYNAQHSMYAYPAAETLTEGHAAGSTSQLPWQPSPGALYSNVPTTTASRNTPLPHSPPIETNRLNRQSNSDLSPRSSIAVETPTSVISQPLHTRYESPSSHHSSDRSVGRNSNPVGSASNLPRVPSTKRSSREMGETARNSLPAQPAQPDAAEQKDASLGIGIGSAYVQRMRADAGETHISRQPLTLPVGLRRTAKSTPLTVKPEFLRRAIDIRYTHLPQRMLETEVDDDDDDQDNVHPHRIPTERPSEGESFDSPRGSVAISHRSSSPVDSIIEQTGKIKLFVANPGND